MFGSLDGKCYWAGNMPSIDSKKVHRLGTDAALHHHGREAINTMNDLRVLAQHRFELVETAMQSGSIFKFQVRGSGVALQRDFSQQRIAAGIEVFLYSRHLDPVFLVAASFEAGCQAHLHLRVDTPRECGVRMQVVDTTAHLEKVERIVGELLRRGARRKRTIVNRTPAEAAKPGRDRSARILIL